MNLTDCILSILSSMPMTSVDIWDALADESIRLADLRAELHAMADEGLLSCEGIIGRTCVYRRALAVAS